jgi:hypothetical protein
MLKKHGFLSQGIVSAHDVQDACANMMRRRLYLQPWRLEPSSSYVEVHVGAKGVCRSI